MREIEYIKFDNYNTYTDFKLYIQSIEITEAEAKRTTIDIPGSDGELDFSTVLTGDIKFKNRKLNIELSNLKGKIYFQEYSRIQNALHGKKMKIILSKDKNFFYYGTVNVSAFKTEKGIRSIKISCDVEPYKYDINSSLDDWLWDPFNFENGIINYTKDIKVEGKRKVTIYGRRKKIIPNITCDNKLQVIFNSNTYNLLPGIQRILNIEICEGINTLEFVGNGTVSIEYRGGSL